MALMESLEELRQLAIEQEKTIAALTQQRDYWMAQFHHVSKRYSDLVSDCAMNRKFQANSIDNSNDNDDSISLNCNWMEDKRLDGKMFEQRKKYEKLKKQIKEIYDIAVNGGVKPFYDKIEFSDENLDGTKAFMQLHEQISKNTSINVGIFEKQSNAYEKARKSKCLQDNMSRSSDLQNLKSLIRSQDKFRQNITKFYINSVINCNNLSNNNNNNNNNDNNNNKCQRHWDITFSSQMNVDIIKTKLVSQIIDEIESKLNETKLIKSKEKDKNEENLDVTGRNSHEISQNARRLVMRLLNKYFNNDDVATYQNNYRAGMINHLNINGEGNSEPLLLINNKLISQSEILEKFEINNNSDNVNDHCHILKLDGQYGIRAKCDIPKFTVIGQYCGVETTQNEWDSMFEFTRAENHHTLFIFEMLFDANDIYKCKEKNNINHLSEIEPLLKNKQLIIFDDSSSKKHGSEKENSKTPLRTMIEHLNKEKQNENENENKNKNEIENDSDLDLNLNNKNRGKKRKFMENEDECKDTIITTLSQKPRKKKQRLNNEKNEKNSNENCNNDNDNDNDNDKNNSNKNGENDKSDKNSRDKRKRIDFSNGGNENEKELAIMANVSAIGDLIFTDGTYDPCLVRWINDCRSDLKYETPTQYDLKYWNVEFCGVTVDGWPSVFMIAMRDINKGEQLYGWYGRGYSAAVEMFQFQKNKKLLNKQYIQNRVGYPPSIRA